MFTFADLRTDGLAKTLREDPEGLTMDELDALDRDTAMPRYRVKPADLDYWRKKWCGLRDLAG